MSRTLKLKFGWLSIGAEGEVNEGSRSHNEVRETFGFANELVETVVRNLI